MKKIGALILLFVFIVTLSACQQDNNVVPLILYNEVDPYILQYKDQIMLEADGKLEIVSYDAQNSQVLQNEMIDDILLSNPKILIVNPVDRLGAYTIIDQAKEHDIPIIFINREPLLTDMFRYNKVYYIGAPAEHSASLQAEMVMELFGSPNELSSLDKNDDNTIQLVILKGEQGHQDAEIRSEVIIEELEEYGYDLEILSIAVCDWQKQIAYESTNELLLNLDQEIELVVSNNDFMALGAIDSFIENGVIEDSNEDGIYDHETEPWVPVIGIDGINEAISYLENGSLYGTVQNDSETMSVYLIELVEALLQNRDLDTLSFDFESNKYVWVAYKKYELEE
jgi:methyl-galactoside transport system substrate-binding protein